MDLLLSVVVGIITGLIAGLVSGLWVARILDRQERGRQVRKVSADLVLVWKPLPGELQAKEMTAGSITIKNGSDWPVRQVIVLAPEWLSGHHVPHLGPGREHVEPIAYDVLLANPTHSVNLVVQLTDVRGKVHQWRPATDELFDPSWIPMHSRPVQWFSRQLSLTSQHRFNRLMMKLPEGALIWVWGYHPATGERRSKNPKGRPLV